MQVIQQHHNRDEQAGDEPYVAGADRVTVVQPVSCAGGASCVCMPVMLLERCSTGTLTGCSCRTLHLAAIVGPYDRRLGSLQSSLTWFYVEHAPGQLPAEGQPPASVGCVAKALQTQQLVEDGGRSVAEIAAMPACTLPKLARRYAARPDAADVGGAWRDGCTRLQKLVASLQVRGSRAAGCFTTSGSSAHSW